MQTTTRNKLEIIIEAPVLRRVESFLHEAGVRGWTVLPSLEGAGSMGEWHNDVPLDSEEKRLIFAIASQEATERVLERLDIFFRDYPGVVCVSEVQVLRRDRF